MSTSNATTQSTPSATDPNLPSPQPNADEVHKIYLMMDVDGRILGPIPNYTKWTTKSGRLLRTHIPINIYDWRLVNKDFKDSLWNALMADFYFNVPNEFAREHCEERFNDVWKTHKSRLKEKLVDSCETIEEALGNCPAKVDPSHWKDFVHHVKDPTTKAISLRNVENRKKNEVGHTLGRQGFAQLEYKMTEQNQGRKPTRSEVWMKGHERSDGTILPSAKEPYELVKDVQEKKKSSSMADGKTNSSATCEDIDLDAVTEVLGLQKKGGTRGCGSHVSRKKQRLATLGRMVLEQQKPNNADEIRGMKNSINTLEKTMSNLEKVVMTFVQHASHKDSSNVEPSTGRSAEVGSNSGYCPPQKTMMNLFDSVEPSPTSSRPKVTLLIRNGKHVAKGFVETGSHAGICHGQQILPHEKKVWVEEVLDGSAPIYDGPQDGNSVMQDVIEGAYLIWPAALLEYT